VIKLIAVGIWACLVTAVTSMASVSWQSSGAATVNGNSPFDDSTIVKPRLVSVPIIKEGKVQGYVVARIAYMVDEAVLAQLSFKPDLILVDEAISTIYMGNGIDFRKLEPQDLASFKKALAKNVNSRVGTELVSEVLIEELDYLTKEEVRARKK
jgi:hypothetical protein